MITKRNAFTHRLLKDAGLAPGMRVLDVGCGSGEVTLLAATMVGEAGTVIGVDLNDAALQQARQAAKEVGLSNVSFLLAGLDALPAKVGPFDAIIGRRVLMYQPDAVASVKSLLPHLKNGGLVVFQESDSVSTGFAAVPMPLHAMVQAWIWQTVATEGGDIHMGLNLYATLQKAGLNHVQMQAEAVLETPQTKSDLAWLTKMMLPRITQYRVATEEEIGIDTLEQRLWAEQEQTNTTIIRDMAFGAWALYGTS